jgi:hypothetical protein
MTQARKRTTRCRAQNDRPLASQVEKYRDAGGLLRLPEGECFSCGAQNHRPLVSRLIVGVLADCCDGVAAYAGRANGSVSRLRLVESRVEGSPLVGCHGSLTAGLRPRFIRLAEFRLWGFLAPVIASSKL